MAHLISDLIDAQSFFAPLLIPSGVKERGPLGSKVFAWELALFLKNLLSLFDLFQDALNVRIELQDKPLLLVDHLLAVFELSLELIFLNFYF